MAGRICAAPPGWSTSPTDAEPMRTGPANRRMRWLLRLGLGLSLAGCAATPPPAEPAATAPPPAALDLSPPAEPQISQASFCGTLTTLIESERDGFARLRGGPVGDETWAGRRTLPGTDECVIEGDAWPRARYECAAVPVERADRAASRFALLSEQIDDCLAGPGWRPRTWQRNEPFDFAMGERQQTWTDLSSLPPSAVVLKLQRGLSGDDYRVVLDLMTIR